MTMSTSKFLIKGNFIYMVTSVTSGRMTLFSKPSRALIIQSCIFNGMALQHYWLLAFVVMPDHIHLVVKPRLKAIDSCVGSLKGASAREVNRMERLIWNIWQPGYIARPIESSTVLSREIEYLENNPVRAGLADSPTEYGFSSAAIRYALDLDMLDSSMFWE